jgi:hypothetical protein
MALNNTKTEVNESIDDMDLRTAMLLSLSDLATAVRIHSRALSIYSGSYPEFVK